MSCLPPLDDPDWSATATPTVWQLGAHECESRDANVHLCAASTNKTSWPLASSAGLSSVMLKKSGNSLFGSRFLMASWRSYQRHGEYSSPR